jgi:hypothetical protein
VAHPDCIARVASIACAVATALAAASPLAQVTRGAGSGAPSGREHDAGWMTVQVPPGWKVESKVDGGFCPLAHVKVFDDAGGWVFFGLDMECGGEWNDGVWKLRLGDDGRLVVTDAPPPLKCRSEADLPPSCGHADYLIAGLVRFGNARYLTVQLGHRKRRRSSDLPVLRAIVESARLRTDRLPKAPQ